MKLIGRQSIASLMRWVLGLINVVVAFGVVVSAIGVVLSMMSPDFGAGFLAGIASASDPREGDARSVPIVLIAGFIAGSCAWWVINRLRRIFQAVNEGDAFEPANVNRLRAMGLGLIGVQIGAAFLAYGWPMNEAVGRRWDFGLGAWLGIFVVFLLAEVFRAGSAMRDEQQMTV